jgi:hypothetical protein
MPRSLKEEAARNSPGLFHTANLNLAAYLVASNRLALDHIEPHAKHSEFVFLDPECIGATVAAEFITKDPKCSAKLLLEARASLLNQIRREGGFA